MAELMRPNQIVLAVTIVWLVAFAVGCFSQTLSGTVAHPTVQSNIATQHRAVRIPTGQTSDRSEGIVGTAGTAIGDIVLFPFRAITDAVTPPAQR